MIYKDYDLEFILISPRIEQTWLSMMGEFSKTLAKKYPDIDPSEIEDEYFRHYPLTGTGEIRCKVRSTICKLRVPAGEFKINK